MSHSESNRRILKNTLALYFRQLITMAVSLFTSRVILQTLGVTDYGINNVVGGVVSMLSFLTGSLSNTTQRFLNVELGKNNPLELKKIFSNSLSLHVIFILVVVVLAETVGLWFVKNRLVIPPERVNAAFWVYQFSVIMFSESVFFAPFEGAIKAHERFSFYAKMSIYDVTAKLAVVYLLFVLPFDKLISYSLLALCVKIIGRIIVYIYCRKYFEECRINFSWAKDRVQRLIGYNIYKMLDSVSNIMRSQGLNVVLNLYYGPVLNAAQGIAHTVFSALSSFSNNAMAATAPQIVKSYAKEDYKRLWNLIINATRLYFYLMLTLTLPFILEIDAALYIWLGKYPEYAAIFTRLFLFDALLKVFVSPMMDANAAVGKLRANTINLVVCRLCILVFAVIIGMNNVSPVYIYVTYLVFQVISIIAYMIVTLKMQLGFSLRKYFTDVMVPILKTSLILVPIPVIVHYFFSKSTLSSFLIGFFTLLWSITVIFFVGLRKNEKQMIVNKLRSFFEKNKRAV